jgi:predicted PurR-regulated permease PerM
VGFVAGYLSEVVIPLFAAFLFGAVLSPLDTRLRNWHWPAWAAALVCVVLLICVPGGLLVLVGTQIAAQWSELTSQTSHIWDQLTNWLSAGPLHIDGDRWTRIIDEAETFLQDRMSTWTSLVVSTGQGLLAFLVGVVLCLFALFFFLKDGRRIAEGLAGVLPASMSDGARPAFQQGWKYMVSYVRAVILVAACDGLGAGIGALILGSHLWIAIVSLTFVCAFIPMAGAIIAGAVSTLVVLATLGWVKAVVMLVIFVAILQLESHVMQPLLLSRAVDIHPLVVLIGITIGMSVAGITGGVFAIPIVAMVVGIIRSLSATSADSGRTAIAAPESLAVE